MKNMCGSQRKKEQTNKNLKVVISDTYISMKEISKVIQESDRSYL